ncbi:60 kDa chaperonin 3 [Chlamydiales bacterium SCGC AG-110-P3]|nr:60 kDa chaperonin 3 [Chlamydiales bacterium SCGC AG-110-P3]
MSTSPKDIIFDTAAREKLLAGINALTDVIACTLGPKGRNVGLEKSWGAPSITNDGNSIVKEIELQDDFENMGVSMAKEVAQNIKDKCGDGTTTGTILLRAMVEAGVKHVAAGASPIAIKRGIDKAIEATVADVKKRAIPVNGSDDIRNIAVVSASGDTTIGEVIAAAVEQVGNSGVITIEEGKATTTNIDIVEGMQFDRGYLSAYFCTNAEKLISELANPQILLVDKKISNIHELLPILQATASTGRELLIIAEDVEADALSTLVINRIRGTLKVAAVKAPGFGDRRKSMLQDLATLTGATVIAEEAGITLKDADATVLGSAEAVTITKDNTTIVNGAGDKAQIAARVKELENEAETTESSYDREKLEERKAKLGGGVAVIRVGAATEPEMKQKKQAFEDSLNSTKAAMAEGVVPGGGVTLLRAAKAVEGLNLEGDEKLGADIVIRACSAPLKQIASNTGLDGSIVVSEVASAKDTFGFNALTEQVEDLMKAGVIDAAKVVRNCLTHAASLAGIVLISEALITDANEEEE